jgi:hypothetical protein
MLCGGEEMTWDGDDLAGQMEEAVEHQQAMADAPTQRVHLTAEGRAREGKRESLRLSLSRVQDQLTRASNPAHRAMLESAQASITAKLDALKTE